MAFFLRYTSNAELDLKRATSLHSCDNNQKDAEFIEGFGWAIILTGLCGYQIEALNEADALVETAETVAYNRKNYRGGHPAEGDGISAYLFEGVICGDCIDGDLFKPTKIISIVLTNK